MIEQGVPMPPRGAGLGNVRVELDKMGVGDSVVFAGEDRERVNSSVSYRQLRYGKKFARRTQPDGSVRVWRVA